MAYSIDICDAPVTCHAWNKDGTQVALCPNTSEIQIYKVNGKDKELLHTLCEHTQVVSGIDWDPICDRIVSCSHDRNAYVWEKNQEGQWVPVLVQLRLRTAATSCRWSSSGTRFVVTTGAQKLRVCYYDTNHNWWQSMSLATAGRGESTCFKAEFMPGDVRVLVAQGNGHCSLITTDEAEASAMKQKAKGKGVDKKKYNYVLTSLQTQGWTNCCAVSPSGAWIAYSSQDSVMYIVKGDELTNTKGKITGLPFNGLPLTSLAFLSETAVVGAGFDCQPRLFYYNGSAWEDLGLIDVPEVHESAAGGGATNSIASRMSQFGGKAVTKATTIHSNVVLEVRRRGNTFTTCSNDGTLGIWPLDKIQAHFQGKKLW